MNQEFKQLCNTINAKIEAYKKLLKSRQILQA